MLKDKHLSIKDNDSWWMVSCHENIIFSWLVLSQVMQVTECNFTCDSGTVKNHQDSQWLESLLACACACLLFSPLSCRTKDLMADPEAGPQTNSRSRCGGREVHWFQATGAERLKEQEDSIFLYKVVEGNRRRRQTGWGGQGSRNEWLDEWIGFFLDEGREDVLKGWGEGTLAIGRNGWRFVFFCTSQGGEC